MPKAIVVHETGKASNMKFEEVKVGKPKKGEVLINQKAIGLNYIDVYFRTGLYPAPQMPLTPGMEAAGDVIAVGAGVKDFKAGDRVAYGSVLGAYAEERIVPADRLVKIPKGISYELAASVMLKGMTTEYLLRRTWKIKKGDTILFHAAAGGVGSMATQWANHLGATVIGTVGSKEKAKIAKAQGCHHVINYREKDFVSEVMRITKNKGVDVVYDGIGKDTFPGSLDCIRPLGMWITFGQASGSIPDINLALLSQKGSLFVTRPTLMTYIAKREDLVMSTKAMFGAISKGIIKVTVNQTYPLKDAAKAHRDLEGRKTTGATVLMV
ncbi:MAG: quinone oxidoreductase [Rhizobiales bacterium]|nr:quinone oxidoreductase [Hyphomicrobiales bacterium]